LKENIKNANTKRDNDDKDDEVQLEDPSEDVKDSDEGKKGGETNQSETKLSGAIK